MNNKEISVWCEDNRLRLKQVQTTISNLISGHPIFKSYSFASQMNKYFYIVSHEGRYIGFYHSKKDSNSIFRECVDVSFEKLLEILSNKRLEMNNKAKVFEVSTKISMIQVKVDNFDAKRYS